MGMQAHLLTLDAARALRDGGIDAMAALDSALAIAMGHAPESLHRDMKHAVGRAMSAIMDETLYPVTRAFPALDPSDEVWRSVARQRARARVASFPPDA